MQPSAVGMFGTLPSTLLTSGGRYRNAVYAYGVLSGCFRLRNQYAVLAVHGVGIKFLAPRIRTPHTRLGTHTTFQHPIPRSGCHGRGQVMEEWRGRRALAQY
jgi:hypothetical protein